MSTQSHIPQTPGRRALSRATKLMEEAEKKARTKNTREEKRKKALEMLKEIKRQEEEDIKKNKTLAQEMRNCAKELLDCAKSLVDEDGEDEEQGQEEGTGQKEGGTACRRWRVEEDKCVDSILSENFNELNGKWRQSLEGMADAFLEAFFGRSKKAVLARFTAARSKYKKAQGWDTYGKNTYNKWVEEQSSEDGVVKSLLPFEKWTTLEAATVAERAAIREAALQAKMGESP